MSDKADNGEQQTELPNVYFNGFQLGLSNADINGILMLNNQPSIGISMSYTTAKTLSQALNEMVQALESVTQHEIMTTKEVARGIEQLSGAKGGDNGQPN